MSAHPTLEGQGGFAHLPLVALRGGLQERPGAGAQHRLVPPRRGEPAWCAMSGCSEKQSDAATQCSPSQLLQDVCVLNTWRCAPGTNPHPGIAPNDRSSVVQFFAKVQSHTDCILNSHILVESKGDKVQASQTYELNVCCQGICTMESSLKCE